jgi:hypothetical protein
MAIGRTDEWQKIRLIHRQYNAVQMFGYHSRNLSGPAAMMPRQQAEHMTAVEPPPSLHIDP